MAARTAARTSCRFLGVTSYCGGWAGVGRIGDWYEQGNWYRGGAEQMLFFTWLYGVQNTQRPRFDRDTPRDDMIRLSRYFDLAPEMPSVNWVEALWHLPVEDLKVRYRPNRSGARMERQARAGAGRTPRIPLRSITNIDRF